MARWPLFRQGSDRQPRTPTGVAAGNPNHRRSDLSTPSRRRAWESGSARPRPPAATNRQRDLLKPPRGDEGISSGRGSRIGSALLVTDVARIRELCEGRVPPGATRARLSRGRGGTPSGEQSSRRRASTAVARRLWPRVVANADRAAAIRGIAASVDPLPTTPQRAVGSVIRCSGLLAGSLISWADLWKIPSACSGDSGPRSAATTARVAATFACRPPWSQGEGFWARLLPRRSGCDVRGARCSGLGD